MIIIRGRGQRFLQIISLTTLVDLIRVPKARTSGEYPPIDINFESIFARGSWRNLGYFFVDPLPSFNWWAGRN